MFKAKATIQNEAGIHCRPSAILVKAALEFEGEILITSKSGRCDLSSTLEILMMELQKGTEVTIELKGPDEETFGKSLVELFETKFDFPPQA